MKFQLPLIAVQNVEVSKKFYCELFQQEVVLDFGKNVTFSGGFAIQQDFAWLTGLPPQSVQRKSHNMELYFEVEDFDGFLETLKNFEVEYVHPPKTHDWLQRVVRIYDPDGHIIEIGEDMKVVIKRCLLKGCSVEETVQLTQHPLFMVEECQMELGIDIERV